MTQNRPFRSRHGGAIGWTRRSFMVGGFAGACALGSRNGWGATASRLFVFLPTGPKPRTLQKTLQEALGSREVTVFGRQRDFRNQIASAEPDAVLAPRVVLESLGLSGHLQGLLGGRDEEPYVAMSVGAPFDPAAASPIVVGAVDFLGRRDMLPFVTKLVGRKSPMRVKLVTKSEDLISLLRFDVAGAIVVPSRMAAKLGEGSQLDLRTTPLTTRVGLAAAHMVTPRGRQLLDELKGMAAKHLSHVGVDAWRS